MYQLLRFFEKFYFMPNYSFDLQNLYQGKKYVLTFKREKFGKKEWLLVGDGEKVFKDRDQLLVYLSATKIDLISFEQQVKECVKGLVYQSHKLNEEATGLFGENFVKESVTHYQKLAQSVLCELTKKDPSESMDTQKREQKKLRIIKN